MFAYCINDPASRKDTQGTFGIELRFDGDEDPFDDLWSNAGGGYANAYNPIDAGYQYGVDLSIAARSSLTHGGIYNNGYVAYSVHVNPTGTSSVSPAPIAACFIAGTLVHSEVGNVPIESILAGDLVWAWNEETGEVALKEVVETYINETNELIHVFVKGEEIVATPSHPFYSPVKGWTDAVHLRAGDILVLLNGEYVVVEKVQHEILENPITVYNFQVEGYHTYYVSDSGVLVHNRCTNPNGKKGSEAHQNTIQSIKSDLLSRGYEVILEYRVNTNGGYKNTRYLDIYATNGSDFFGIQVGRMTQRGLPVARERRALSDIGDSGVPVIFIRYN